MDIRVCVEFNRESKARQGYLSPTLREYGSVRGLTQSGSGMSSESNGDMGNCIFDPNKKPCSELRVKENVMRVGEHPLGFGLYLFNYRAEYRDQWGRGRQFGVMIDEVEVVLPEAVSLHSDGFKRVDYAMLGIKRLTH